MEHTLPPGDTQVVGSPARAASAASPLTATDVLTLLTHPALPATMDLLGIDEPDREQLLEVAPAVVRSEVALNAVAWVANSLRAEAGLTAPVPPIDDAKDELNALQLDIMPGQGLLAILGHVAATDTVRAWHASRGLDDVQSWRSLSDLGQQLRVHRRVFGELGHHTLNFTAKNWAGRLFWFGRLQFELLWDERATPQPRWVIDVHIPATGRLLPADVDDAFDAATAYFSEHFADLGAGRPADLPAFGREFTCRSWLLGPDVPAVVGPDSNLGSFAGRWTLEETFDASADTVFFVFRSRRPHDLSEVQRDTRLAHTLYDRLTSGAGWLGARGRYVR